MGKKERETGLEGAGKKVERITGIFARGRCAAESYCVEEVFKPSQCKIEEAERTDKGGARRRTRSSTLSRPWIARTRR